MSMEAAAFQVIRGGVVTTDLAGIQLSDGTSIYSLVATNWGLGPDAARVAEKFRKLGAAGRFILGTV